MKVPITCLSTSAWKSNEDARTSTKKDVEMVRSRWFELHPASKRQTSEGQQSRQILNHKEIDTLFLSPYYHIQLYHDIN
jgi:hypothetical protein